MANISEKIIEERLRWLGNLERATGEDVVTRTWKMEVGGNRTIGRQKLRWSDFYKKLVKNPWILGLNKSRVTSHNGGTIYRVAN